MKIKTALLSVTNKKELEHFAKCLAKHGVRILASGGTEKHLVKHGIECENVSSVTGQCELLNGRVKTLHTHIHAGILSPSEEALEGTGIPKIDMVVCNFYDFSKVMLEYDESKVVESIDIGGPTMVRGAAKNFHACCVVTDPEDYEALIYEMNTNDGEISFKTRRRQAIRAFGYVEKEDTKIFIYFGRK